MHNSMALSENIWISASAGSGKTKALIDKFLKILLDGTPPTKILCVTFTKAAAAEMFKRITEELIDWAICDEAKLIKKVTKLTEKTPGPSKINFARNCFKEFIRVRGEIHINTIHAFCQKLIEKFPQECHLDPGHKLADEQFIKTLVEEAKISFLNDDSIFSDRSIQYLFADLNESKLDSLLDKILHIHNLSPNFFMAREKLVRYIEGLRQDLKLPDNYSQERELKELINKVRKKIKQAKTGLMVITEWLGKTVTMSDKDIFSCLKNLFLTKKNTPRVSVLKKDEITPESELLISKIQTLLLTHLENESAYKIYKQTFGFLSLGYFFMMHYINVKNKHKLLDYGDIVQRGLALLKEGEASTCFLYHLNNRFHHILVDEAQDLNKTQWELIQALSNEFFYNLESIRSIFVVGDPKQAIYSFQGSSPSLFAETKTGMQKLAKHYHIQMVHSELNESFRSDPIVLKFVDQVFKILRKRNPAYFIEEINHISNRKFEKSSIEVWPLVSMKKDEAFEEKNQTMKWQISKEYKEIQNSSEILANKIAMRIKNLLQERYLPSDIMILVRRRDKLVEQIIMALKAENIPVSGADRLILNNNLAIQDLLAVGRFLLSSYDDYNLACLLKSPIFSITEKELFELCDRGEISLWENIKRQDKPRYKKISAFLTDLLENKSVHRPYQFFFLYT